MSHLILYATISGAIPLSAQEEIDKVLDKFHKAASEAKYDEYFSYFAEEAVFLGTDAEERWTLKEFKAYAKPSFDKGKGWTYTKRSRHIQLNAENNIAWFDELLDSASYGTSRGSGVLLRSANQWKIAQYNLSFPIPNDLAKAVTKDIKAFEKSKAKPN